MEECGWGGGTRPAPPHSQGKTANPRPLPMRSLLGHHLFLQDSSCSGSPKASSFPLVILQSLKKKKNRPGKCPSSSSQQCLQPQLTQLRANLPGIPRPGTFLTVDHYFGGLPLSLSPSKPFWFAAALKLPGEKMERGGSPLRLSLALWLSSAMILQAWNLRNFLPCAPWKS